MWWKTNRTKWEIWKVLWLLEFSKVQVHTKHWNIVRIEIKGRRMKVLRLFILFSKHALRYTNKYVIII